MKKRLFLAAVVVFCVAFLASGTVAYFTAEDTAHNVITSGAVNVQIEEWQETEDGLVAYPEEDVCIMPGSIVSKIVQVKNLDAGSYIRAKFDLVFTFDNIPAGETPPTIPENLVTLNIDDENWIRVEGDDEWWYYNATVEEDGVTEPFFTEVVFSGPEMGNEYQNCTVEVIVQAQAVQAANNGSSVIEAAGWPEN